MASMKVNNPRHHAQLPHTKIVCTLGPSSSDRAVLRAMIESGMSVARVNLSHGQHSNHSRQIDTIRQLQKEMGRVVAIMADLQGPKVRIGDIEDEPLKLTEDNEYILTSSPSTTEKNVIPVPYREIIRGVQVGGTVWLSDGLIELIVISKAGDNLHCQAPVGGELYSKQGIVVPGVRVNIPSITQKDLTDLEFAVAQKVDFVAMSFVRTADDVQKLRNLIEAAGANIPIVAKIEHPEALNNLDCIIEAADALMDARGDLGVQSNFEEVPAHQSRIVRACNRAAVPVITATQMLHSMTHSTHPTRAEANDIFNSVIQGTDAVMLSSETAIGEHPARCVTTMARIARMAEQYFPYKTWDIALDEDDAYSIPAGIGEATSRLATKLGAEAILTSTMTGRTTRLVAKHRPRSRIISTTPNLATHKQMALVWGVTSLLTPAYQNTDEMAIEVRREALKAGLIKQGDTIIITSGVPIGLPGYTNLLEVYRVEGEDVL